LFPEATGLAEAPVADAARLATTYIRGERFGDGAIEQALQNGALLAILARLRRWFETEHPERQHDPSRCRWTQWRPTGTHLASPAAPC
jgi:hypothetical protein